MIGQIELALRVAAGLFVVVAPTLLFLGLWRGLALLRDDELVERVREQGALSSSPDPTVVATSMLPDADSETVTCESCGTPNLADATYCQEYLGKLPAQNGD